MILRSQISLRVYTFIFAAALAAQAGWLLAPELTRPSLNFFPSSKSEVELAAAHRGAAAQAARLGWIRGDLWLDYAVTVDANLLETSNPSAESSEPQSVTMRAAMTAPYDSRAWLLLAAINAKQGWKDNGTLGQLKMSFYTSPNEIRVIPLRMRIAARSDALADPELQGLVEHDMRNIVLYRPGLKPSLATAYREGSPAGRQFIEDRLADIDSNFASELRATKK